MTNVDVDNRITERYAPKCIALDWIKPAHPDFAWTAAIPNHMGFFATREYSGKWVTWFSIDDEFLHTPIFRKGGTNEYPSLEEAKAACQADFERRVLSCLEEGE